MRCVPDTWIIWGFTPRTHCLHSTPPDMKQPEAKIIRATRRLMFTGQDFEQYSWISLRNATMTLWASRQLPLEGTRSCKWPKVLRKLKQTIYLIPHFIPHVLQKQNDKKQLATRRRHATNTGPNPNMHTKGWLSYSLC